METIEFVILNRTLFSNITSQAPGLNVLAYDHNIATEVRRGRKKRLLG